MAKAITHIEKQTPDRVEEQAQAIGQILEAVAENRGALTILLDILKELNQAGMLDIVQGLLKNRQQVGVIAISQLNQTGGHNLMKNGMNALQFLSKLDPVKLQSILNALGHGIDQFGDTNTEKPKGIWGMTKAIRDPDVALSISTMLNFLRGMGEGLHQEQKSVH